jgi:hypothetical protein
MIEKIVRRTINERVFATTVGLSYQKIKQMRQQGGLKHLRVGRRIFYLYPEHVEDFLRKFEQSVG